MSWDTLSSTVAEGGGATSVQLLLSRPTASGRIVQVTVNPEGGEPSYDITVTFLPDLDTAWCNVSFIDDSLCGEREIRLTIISIIGGDSSVENQIDANPTHTLTVTDDDGLSGLTLSGLSPICHGDPALFSVSTTPTSSEWPPPGWTAAWDGVDSVTITPAGEGMFHVTPDTPGTYLLQLTLSNGTCTVSGTADLVAVAPHVANAYFVDDTMVCSGHGVGIQADLQTGWHGAWSAAEGAFNGDSTTFTYTGTGSEVSLIWEITDSLGVCPSDSVSLNLGIVQPPTAEIYLAWSDTCQGGEYEIFGNPPGALQTGIWSISPESENNIIDTIPGGGLFFQPMDPGPYQLIWTVNDDTGHCPASADSSSIVVHHRPIAGTDSSITLCTEEPGLNLFSVLGGSPDTGGVWSGMDGSQHSGIFDPDSLPTGTYDFTYTVSGVACPAAMAQVEVTTASTPDTPGSDGIMSIDGLAFCAGQYTMVSIRQPAPGVTHHWSCEGCEIAVDTGTVVQLLWTEPGPGTYSVYAAVGGCTSDSLEVSVTIDAMEASCPQGIAYFEPHGLAIIDPLADQFQWGRMENGTFVVKVGATAQTIFDPVNIAGCIPYYAVRSRRGTGCWTTTTTCLDDTPERVCDTGGGNMADEGLKLSVSPNPVHGGRIQLLLEGVEPGGDLIVELFSTGGHLVFRHQRQTEPIVVLDVLDWPLPGLYLLRIHSAGRTRSSKITIN